MRHYMDNDGQQGGRKIVTVAMGNAFSGFSLAISFRISRHGLKGELLT
jgi:hypothetical protein